MVPSCFVLLVGFLVNRTCFCKVLAYVFMSTCFLTCLVFRNIYFLFFTGVLLRKLEAGLHGVSHVIVDEIHERDINASLIMSTFFYK
jgi:hypothetical protein